jgi:hypothetical protein
LFIKIPSPRLFQWRSSPKEKEESPPPVLDFDQKPETPTKQNKTTTATNQTNKKTTESINNTPHQNTLSQSQEDINPSISTTPLPGISSLRKFVKDADISSGRNESHSSLMSLLAPVSLTSGWYEDGSNRKVGHYNLNSDFIVHPSFSFIFIYIHSFIRIFGYPTNNV